MHTADDGLTVSRAGDGRCARRRRVVRQTPLGAGRHPAASATRLRAHDQRAVFRQPRRGHRLDRRARTPPKPAEDTPSRRAVFVCRPAVGNVARRTPCARTILSRLARRAYRRPVTEQDLDDAARLLPSGTGRGRIRGGHPARAAADPGVAKLPVPHRTRAGERRAGLGLSPQRHRSGVAALVLPVEQHSGRGTARRGGARHAQHSGRSGAAGAPDARRPSIARRSSTTSPASGSRSTNSPASCPTSTRIRSSTRTCATRSGRRRGCSSSAQLREDRSVGELLTANYTYVNERLARHYQIPNVYGSHFRRVTFTDGRRGGLLGQGSILTVTSYPNRTSPVLRGRWLLDNILGAPPPPPPPDVPSLQEGSADGRPRSIREQMEAHRKNPSCAVCHVRMDPLGFSLENFDALGKWRTSVDAHADRCVSLASGRHDVRGRRRACASWWPAIRRTSRARSRRSCWDMRSGGASNRRICPAIRQITKNAASGGYRWSSLIMGIVRSTPFTMSTTRERRIGRRSRPPRHR